MLQFSANLTLLFKELPLLERFNAAKESGFSSVEIQFPYEIPARHIKKELDLAGLELVLINVPAGDFLNGGEGLAAVPSKKKEFMDAINIASEYVDILNPKFINVLAGCCQDNKYVDKYMETLLDNLSFAADFFLNKGIKLVFEGVNTRDWPGFLIHNNMQMIKVLEILNHSNVYMQYDIYHMHTMGEDYLSFLHEQISKIGHIQFADSPGRHQPGTGKIDFNSVFKVIEKSIYNGFLGAEYIPNVDTLTSLDWFNPYRQI